MSNTDEILTEFDNMFSRQVLSDVDIDKLVLYSKHNNEEIRSYVAQILILSTSQIAKKNIVNTCQGLR